MAKPKVISVAARLKSSIGLTNGILAALCFNGTLSNTSTREIKQWTMARLRLSMECL